MQFFYCPLSPVYVFIESSSIKAIGRKIKTGSQDQNSGIIWPNTTSVAISLQAKFTTKQAAVIRKLIKIADFIVLGSRQTNIGRLIISITRLMIGSVIRKCFWL